MLIKPKTIQIKTMDGETKSYILSRFPATDGMEIFYRIPTSAMPKIGDFEALKGVRDDIFKFIAVEINGAQQTLSMKALIDSHVPDAETGLKLIGAMLEYNYSFFQRGTISAFFDVVAAKVPDIAQRILIQLSDALSKQNKRP